MEGTKTILTTNENGMYVVEKPFTTDIGCRWFFRSKAFMPEIVDVEVAKDKEGNEKCVIVYFADGTKEKSPVQEGDEFDLRVGIERCVIYKLVGIITGFTNDGKRIFNKISGKAVKFYNNKIRIIEGMEKAHEEEQQRIAKKAEKKKKRKEKIEAMRKAQRIEEQTQAYINAIRAIRNETVTDASK